MKNVEFHADIKKIEKEVIDYLVNFPLFMGQKSSTLTVQSYFFTRAKLTQSKLQELTGLSAGTISQALHELIERKLIKKSIKPSSKGEYLYSMESVGLSFLISMINMVKDSTKWVENLQKIENDLKKNENQYKDLHGYDKILYWTKYYLKAFDFLENFLLTLEKERKKWEKKIQKKKETNKELDEF